MTSKALLVRVLGDEAKVPAVQIKQLFPKVQLSLLQDEKQQSKQHTGKIHVHKS